MVDLRWWCNDAFERRTKICRF